MISSLIRTLNFSSVIMWREEKVAKKRDYSNCKFYSVSNNIHKGPNVMLRNNKCKVFCLYFVLVLLHLFLVYILSLFAVGSDDVGYHHEIKYSAYSALFFPKFIRYYNLTVIIIVFYK